MIEGCSEEDLDGMIHSDWLRQSQKKKRSFVVRAGRMKKSMRSKSFYQRVLADNQENTAKHESMMTGMGKQLHEDNTLYDNVITYAFMFHQVLEQKPPDVAEDIVRVMAL